MEQLFYFSGAYIIGLIAALSYKIAIPIVKHRMRQEFKLRLLIIPYSVGMMVTLPLVFMVLPALGPPRGEFISDFAYAFFTAYGTMDITADLFRLQEEVRRYLERSIGKTPNGVDDTK